MITLYLFCWSQGSNSKYYTMIDRSTFLTLCSGHILPPYVNTFGHTVANIGSMLAGIYLFNVYSIMMMHSNCNVKFWEVALGLLFHSQKDTHHSLHSMSGQVALGPIYWSTAGKNYKCARWLFALSTDCLHGALEKL